MKKSLLLLLIVTFITLLTSYQSKIKKLQLPIVPASEAKDTTSLAYSLERYKVTISINNF